MSQTDTDRREPPEPLVMSDTEILDWINDYGLKLVCKKFDDISYGWEVSNNLVSVFGLGLKRQVCRAAAILKQYEDHDE